MFAAHGAWTPQHRLAPKRQPAQRAPKRLRKRDDPEVSGAALSPAAASRTQFVVKVGGLLAHLTQLRRLEQATLHAGIDR
jgi:hypothetical protein